MRGQSAPIDDGPGLVEGRIRRLERPSADVLAPLAVHNPQWEAEIAAMLHKAGWPA
jgi:hypothetical protein